MDFVQRMCRGSKKLLLKRPLTFLVSPLTAFWHSMIALNHQLHVRKTSKIRYTFQDTLVLFPLLAERQ